MIAHVAAAGEQRGRVVLRVTGGNPSGIALAAAIRVARAFQSELEGLFVEDRQLFDLCCFPFAREISVGGRQRRGLDAAALESEFRGLARVVGQKLAALSRAADVPFTSRIVRDEPVHAVAAACAECGPWNVVAIGEPIGPAGSAALRRLMEEVREATGIVVVGPRARRTDGAIVVVIEDEAYLAPLLQAAERLQLDASTAIVLLLVADDAERLGWAEAQARLVAADRTDVRIVVAPLHRGQAAVVAEAVRRLAPGFVIGQYGGLLVPRDDDLAPLVAALEAPLFLVR